MRRMSSDIQLSSAIGFCLYSRRETPYKEHYDALVYPVQVALAALHSPCRYDRHRPLLYPIASGLGSGQPGRPMIRA